MLYLSGLRCEGRFLIATKREWVFWKRLRVFLLAILISCSLVAFAKADFRVCNTTQQSVGVALGYRTLSGWVSEGWWVVPVTECQTLIEGPLSSRFYYFYAEGAQKKGNWPGSVTMCVQDSQFTIQGVHDCFPRGYQKADFKEIDTGNQTSWMVQLTDEALFGDSVVNSSSFSGVSPP
ncbi:putative membrane protein [Bartonella silvatica]|uniref:Membrane protein n=1 Tax=Bartonella silvatica TaxID=357760 RepID=A0ABV2HFB8_9HYPH